MADESHYLKMALEIAFRAAKINPTTNQFRFLRDILDASGTDEVRS